MSGPGDRIPSPPRRNWLSGMWDSLPIVPRQENTLQQDIAHAYEQSERPSEKQIVSENHGQAALSNRIGANLIYAALLGAFATLCVQSLGQLFANPLWRAAFAVVGFVGAVTMLVLRTWLLSQFRAPSAGLIIGAAAVLLMVVTLGPYVQEERWPTIPFTTHGFTQQQVDEKIAAAVGPLKTENSQLRTDLEEMTRQRNAALSRQQQTVPQASSQQPQTTLSGEEIATRSDLWQTVQKYVNSVVSAYNYGDTLIGTWEDQIPSNKKDYLRQLSDLRAMIVAASGKIQELRRDYPNYQDISVILDQNYLGPLLNSIDNFSRAITSLPDELPPNYKIIIRPNAGAVRTEMVSMLNWINNVRKAAGIKQKELSDMGRKQ